MRFCYLLAIFGTLFHDSLAVGIQEKLPEDYDYEHPEMFHETEHLHQEPIKKQFDIASTAKYEISENVIDIPDNSTKPGPIVTNFSLTKPLNNATDKTIINTTIAKPKKGHNINTVYDHVESKHKPELDFHNVFLTTEELLHGFKDYIHGVKRGLVNGVNELLNSVNGGVIVPNVVAGPIKFINNAHKQSSEVLRRLHGAIFRERFGIEND